jgi:pyridoxal phosphate enzyme (YggS family)
MYINKEKYSEIFADVKARGATLVAVSKTKPAAAIRELYDMGHRDFGENYVQELTEKQAQLPADIRWHFIGHLQTNKVKYIAPFVHLIHGIDSLKLLKEVDRQAAKNNRSINVLLQMHIAKEETKFGLNEQELDEILQMDGDKSLNGLTHISVKGLMGMASFSDDGTLVRQEFRFLKIQYDKYRTLQTQTVSFQTLSMGMSGDYRIALEEGSNLVRIGSLIFGSR